MKFILPGNVGMIEGTPEEILEFLALMQMNNDIRNLQNYKKYKTEDKEK